MLVSYLSRRVLDSIMRYPKSVCVCECGRGCCSVKDRTVLNAGRKETKSFLGLPGCCCVASPCVLGSNLNLLLTPLLSLSVIPTALVVLRPPQPPVHQHTFCGRTETYQAKAENVQQYLRARRRVAGKIELELRCARLAHHNAEIPTTSPCSFAP